MEMINTRLHLQDFDNYPAMAWRGRCELPGRLDASVYRVRDLTPQERRFLRIFLETQLALLGQEESSDTLSEAARPETAASNVKPAKRPRKKPNLSDEERELRRQRMNNYWSKKRGEAAEIIDTQRRSTDG